MIDASLSCMVDASLMQIMLLGPLNVYVTSSQDGMLKLWSSDTLKPMRAIQNGSGGMFTFGPVSISGFHSFRISCFAFL